MIRSTNKLFRSFLYRCLVIIVLKFAKYMSLSLLLGSCQSLIDTDGIVKLLFARCSNLRSLDLWRSHRLTENAFLSIVGLKHFLEVEEQRIFNFSSDEQEDLALVYSIVNMPVQIDSITHMTYLSEIDFGWIDPPPGFIKNLVNQVGRSLIKIFLTACRRK
jgi:hypothetical protein